MIEDFLLHFPEVLDHVIKAKGLESARHDVVKLTVALIERSRSFTPEEAVDKALYLYERIDAGLAQNKTTANDVLRATGETRVKLP